MSGLGLARRVSGRTICLRSAAYGRLECDPESERRRVWCCAMAASCTCKILVSVCHDRFHLPFIYSSHWIHSIAQGIERPHYEEAHLHSRTFSSGVIGILTVSAG